MSKKTVVTSIEADMQFSEDRRSVFIHIEASTPILGDPDAGPQVILDTVMDLLEHHMGASALDLVPSDSPNDELN